MFALLMAGTASLIVLLMLTQRASAQLPPTTQPVTAGWSWEINLAFANGAPNADLTVRIYDAHTQSVLASSTQSLTTCIPHGSLVINGSTALFNRNTQDYISCNLPNLQKEVYQLSKTISDTLGGPMAIGAICECGHQAPPWAAANVNADLSNPLPGYSVDSHPLFYHPDFQYTLNSDVGSGNLNLDFTPMPFALNPSSPIYSGGWQALLSSVDAGFFTAHAHWTGWAAFLAPHDRSSWFNGRSVQWANGIVLDAADNLTGTKSLIRTGPTTVYFGYNPDTGHSLHGHATHIGADPGCFAP